MSPATRAGTSLLFAVAGTALTSLAMLWLDTNESGKAFIVGLLGALAFGSGVYFLTTVDAERPIFESRIRYYVLTLSCAMVLAGFAFLWIGIAIEQATAYRLFAGSVGAIALLSGFGIFGAWLRSRSA